MSQALQTSTVESLGVTMRLARDDEQDSRRFCRLSNSLYARKVTPAYYHWQFFQTPFPSLLAFATTADDQLAGCYGIHLRDAAPGQQPVGMALDIMVAPAFQGRGLFRALADFALAEAGRRGPSAVYVMANERARGAHVRGLGWAEVGVLWDYVGPTTHATRRSPRDVSTTAVQGFSAEDERFLLEVGRLRRSERRFYVERTPGFLQWRSARNPRYTYQILRCCGRQAVHGFLVVKTFRDPVTGHTFGDIIDVIWRDDHTDVLRALLLAGLAYFEQLGVAEVTTWLYTNPLLGEVGGSLGFRPTTRRRYLSCRVIDQQQLWMEDPARWSVSMLDTDLY
ncbi:MAG: GNAT family N-acetyltransferase [Planctomycetota bacterium]|jgi:GNAT superfamily N-acetyltransferase